MKRINIKMCISRVSYSEMHPRSFIYDEWPISERSKMFRLGENFIARLPISLYID